MTCFKVVWFWPKQPCPRLFWGDGGEVSLGFCQCKKKANNRRKSYRFTNSSPDLDQSKGTIGLKMLSPVVMCAFIRISSNLPFVFPSLASFQLFFPLCFIENCKLPIFFSFHTFPLCYHFCVLRSRLPLLPGGCEVSNGSYNRELLEGSWRCGLRPDI